MVNVRLGPVIAEREYRLVTRDRKRRKVYLRLGKPRPDGEDFFCAFRIEGLQSDARTSGAFGVDGFQALELAMKRAWIDMVHTAAYREGRLTLYGSQDLGLPTVDLPETPSTKDTRPPKPPRASGTSPRTSGKTPRASGKTPRTSGKTPRTSGKTPRTRRT